MLRPVPARWFEALVTHDDAAAALEALARTGTVELEVHAPRQALAPLAALKPSLDAYGDLASRYRPYWPAASGAAPDDLRSPREILEEGLKRLAKWGKAADPIIRRLQALEQEAAELEIWRELFERHRESAIAFDLLRHPDGMLARRLYVFPPDAVPPLPEGVLARRFPLEHHICVLVVGPPEVVADLDRQATALKGRGGRTAHSPLARRARRRQPAARRAAHGRDPGRGSAGAGGAGRAQPPPRDRALHRRHRAAALVRGPSAPAPEHRLLRLAHGLDF